jgi:hypothetical protein
MAAGDGMGIGLCRRVPQPVGGAPPMDAHRVPLYDAALWSLDPVLREQRQRDFGRRFGVALGPQADRRLLPSPVALGPVPAAPHVRGERPKAAHG